MVFRVRRAIAILGGVLLLAPAPAAAASPFSDLGSVPWAKPAVDLLGEEGVIHGVSPGRFDPNAPMTREALAVLLDRAWAPTSTADLSSFSDASAIDGWARQGVAAAVARGWLKGEGHGVLDPTGTVTRAQAATVIARALGLGTAPLASYTDQASIPAWALGAVDALTAKGVLRGEGGGAFDPNRPLTRAEFAVMLARSEPIAGSLKGVPDLVAGRIGKWIAPDDPSLAVTSTAAGPSGGFTLSSGRVYPLSAAASVSVLDHAALLYGLGPGDPVAGIVGAGGAVSDLVDFRPAASAPAVTVENASGTSLDLSDGTALDTGGSVRISFGGQTANLTPPELLGSVVVTPKTPSGTLTVDRLGVWVLHGVVTASSKTSLTIDVTTRYDPLLGTGPLAVTLDASTALQTGGATATAPPPAGTAVTVNGTLAPGGPLKATLVLW